MTDPTNLLDAVKAAARLVTDSPAFNGLRFTHTLTWSDGTVCRCAVQDPNKTDQGYKLAQRLSGLPDVLDVRLLRVRPGDPTPGEGASLPWDGGHLKLISWGQVGDWTGSVIGVCRLTR